MRLLRSPVPGREAVTFDDALVLVSCVSQKRANPAPARELYRSTWFLKVRALLDARGAEWFILSALHGLVTPSDLIDPYEKTLNTIGTRERRDWAIRVRRQLVPHLRARQRILFFAGRRYREFLMPMLEADDFHVEVPMEGLQIGRQLQWLSVDG